MPREIKVGDTATLHRTFGEDDVRRFAELSLDHNPIHLDPVYAAQSQFKQRIVHGALVSSLFSAVLGEQLPGHGGIYMSQSVKFKAPVFLDMEVIAKVEITAIREGTGIVTARTVCTDTQGKILASGEAVMYVPWLRGASAAV